MFKAKPIVGMSCARHFDQQFEWAIVTLRRGRIKPVDE